MVARVGQFVNRWRYGFIGLLAVVSRLAFVDGGVDWFDSPQYLARSQDVSLIGALSTGHAPFHPGYVLWTWLAVHWFSWTGASAGFLVGLTTALFGAGALVVFLALAERWTNARIAALATLLAGITPFLWVGSIGILIDPVMIFWYLLALLLFDHAVQYVFDGPRRTAVFSLAAGGSLGLAVLAHTQIALWGLGFLSVLVIRKQFSSATNWLRLWPLFIGPTLALGTYCWLLVYAGHDSNWPNALRYLIGGNAGDHAPFSLIFAWRNWRAVAGSTLALTGLGAFGWLAFRRPRLGLALLVWFLPGLVLSASYLYSNLYGRSSSLAVFPAALAVAWLIGTLWEARWYRTSGALTVFMVTALLGQSGPLVTGYGHGLGLAEEQGIAERALGGAYILESGENITFRGTETYDVVPVTGENELRAHVRERLAAGQPVYLSSDAWRWPFAKLDGRNLRIDSLAFRGPGEHGSAVAFLADEGSLRLAQLPLSELAWSTYALESRSVSLRERVQRAAQLLEDSGHYQTVLLSRFMSAGQPVSHLFVDAYSDQFVQPSRFDAGDWLVRLWQRLIDRRDPLSWSVTDRDGVAELALPRGAAAHLESIVASTDRLHTAPTIQAVTGQSVATDHRSYGLAVTTSRSFSSLAELEAVVAALPPSQSAIVTLQDRSGDRLEATLWTFDYSLPLTDTIEAEDLSLSDGATVVSRREASNGAEVRFAPFTSGTALYGPYRTLGAGHYRLEYALDVPAAADGWWPLATLQVAGGLEGQHLATSEPITVEAVRRGPISVEFTLDQPTNFLEFRVLPLGAPTSFTLDRLTLARLETSR